MEKKIVYVLLLFFFMVQPAAAYLNNLTDSDDKITGDDIPGRTIDVLVSTLITEKNMGDETAQYIVLILFMGIVAVLVWIFGGRAWS